MNVTDLTHIIDSDMPSSILPYFSNLPASQNNSPT